MKRLMMLMAVMTMAAAPMLATATEQGIRRTYGGDWLAKHRASVDRQRAAEGVRPAQPPEGNVRR
jgi:Ni/Co efflux regulator RcnB